MGKQAKRSLFQTFPAPEEVTKQSNNIKKYCSWEIIEKGSGCDSSTSSIDSANSCSSSLSSSISSDFMEDAKSPSSSSSSSSSNGPLYQLSDLMNQLPIKRGLSKYYQGKSQSFASLASVESVEDLAKRENPCSKRIKLCKSFCGGLHDQRFNSPKPTIAKKASYKSCYASSTLKRNCSNNLMPSCRPTSISVHKDF